MYADLNIAVNGFCYDCKIVSNCLLVYTGLECCFRHPTWICFESRKVASFYDVYLKLSAELLAYMSKSEVSARVLLKTTTIFLLVLYFSALGMMAYGYDVLIYYGTQWQSNVLFVSLFELLMCLAPS